MGLTLHPKGNNLFLKSQYNYTTKDKIISVAKKNMTHFNLSNMKLFFFFSTLKQMFNEENKEITEWTMRWPVSPPFT